MISIDLRSEFKLSFSLFSLSSSSSFSQGNNAYIFPGVALGVIATLMHHIPDDVFLIAARELAANVRDEDLAMGSLYPPLDAIREVSLRIAVGITKYAYCRGMYGWCSSNCSHIFRHF